MVGSLVAKRVLGGMINLEKRDKKWAEIFSNSMFIGMIAAFLALYSVMSGVFQAWQD